MQDDARERVAANVRAELARAGKNQSDLARAMDISRQNVSQRLLGRSAFKAEEIVRIAHWLGVSTETLLAGVLVERVA
jgi:transcriptional regulator with XRE-family HTH domain